MQFLHVLFTGYFAVVADAVQCVNAYAHSWASLLLKVTSVKR